ncbi:hypothetical protein [Luteibacter sp. ME-Dv--P-043b]|jgi:hypothetical protein|uniref:hypothetical protein n=1 Tax=Luteibacter sp. ME-Dv--P-043b TaxID=3040291 RepID=UPI0025523DA0|nr:hypothetical protein [Luteibacter sp. ME-Dv--P-043b]
MVRKRRLRLPFVRRPRDAKGDFDDANYDGGVSGGAYLRHIVMVAVLLVVIAGILRWST